MSRKKKPKKNKHGKIASSAAWGDFHLVKIFGLDGLSNRALLAVLGAVLTGSLILGVNFLSPRAQDWLKYQGQTLLSAIGGGEEADLASFTLVKETRVPILMYHHIGDVPEKSDVLRKDLTVSAADFEIQVAWLKGAGYQSITLNDLLKSTKGKFELPEKSVILTFDDGYEDVFLNAVPILKKYEFVGSFAVITQFVGRSAGTNAYATWQQIREAQRQGMEVVSHTQDHFDGTNPRYGKTFILQNLKDSQNDIKSNLGKALPILVYPYGDYNAQYIELAKEAGFEMALTTNFGKAVAAEKLMEVPRVRIGGSLGIESFKKLVGE